MAHFYDLKLPSLQRNILRPHLKTFVLILPHDGGVEIQEFRGDLVPGAGQETFGFLGRILQSPLIVAGAFPLLVLPMRHGMYRPVIASPVFDQGLNLLG